jgi:hypothetical protein
MNTSIYIRGVFALVFFWSVGSFAEDTNEMDVKVKSWVNQLNAEGVAALEKAASSTATTEEEKIDIQNDIKTIQNDYFNAVSDQVGNCKSRVANTNKAIEYYVEDEAKKIEGGMFKDIRDKFKKGKQVSNVSTFAVYQAIRYCRQCKSSEVDCSSKERGGVELDSIVGAVGNSKPSKGMMGKDPNSGETICVSGRKKIWNSLKSQPGRDAAEEIESACMKNFRAAETELKKSLGTAFALKNQFQKGMKMVIGLGIGAGVVGVGYKVHKDKKDKKKRRRAEAQAAEEYKNGIITLADGSKKECYTTDNYQSEDCRDTMKRLCQDGENASKSGCGAFNGYYCGSGSGNENSPYCLASEVASFCAGPSEVLKTSPACQWMSSRPASCMEKPSDLKCLSNMSMDQLMAACKDYPNDPLCKKAEAGIIVTQPQAIAAQPQDTIEQKAGSSGLNDMVGARGVSSANTNLWQNNSDMLQNLYNTGQLAGGN